MMQSLRAKLAVSHILPILLLMPILSLIYRTSPKTP
jgi:hypothetical protein